MKPISAESMEEVAGEETRLLGHMQTSAPVEVEVSSMFAPGTDPPPLVAWLPLALICALFYALYSIFIKKGSTSIHPILGGVILQIVAALLGAVLCGYLVLGPSEEDMFYDGKGLTWAMLAGLAVGAAEILSFVVNGENNSVFYKYFHFLLECLPNILHQPQL